MPNKYTLNFSQYLNESEGADSKLRGYSNSEIIERIAGETDETGKKEAGLMDIFPDKLRFGIPSDNLGRAVTYRDANGTIQRINDLTNYYSSKGEDVTFYCWSIAFDGSWDATQSLRDKIDSFGGFGNVRNMNIKKVIEYFSQNPEDADNVASISIGIDAKSIRRELQKLKSEEGPSAETSTEGQI